MAGPWEKFQNAQPGGPWSRYSAQQATTPEQSPPSQGGDFVSAAEEQFGIPSGLLRALISKESSGNPNARSPVGAIGLTQVMPATARGMGYNPEELARNPQMQVEAGARYLRQMLDSHGSVTEALAAYNWGPGNVQKYRRGEKTTMPRETVNYINDPRFAQWTQPTPAEGNDELNQLAERARAGWAQPEPEQAFTESAAQAGKGLLQAGVNVANIPSMIGDAIYDADAWVASKLQGKDVTPARMPRFEQPETLKPTDQYAKVGAEVGPYLIPGLGAARTGAAIGSVANAGRAERLATQGANLLAENLPGALAQNSGGNPQGFAGDLALGAAAGGVVKAAAPLLGKAANAVRQSAAPAARESSATAAPAAESGAEATVAEAAPRYAAAAQSGNEGRIAQVINDIQPDENVVNAMRRLDLTPDEMLEAYTSGSDAFKAVQMGLASQDESVLAAVKRDSIARVSERAAKIVDDAGAMPDRLAMDDAFKTRFRATREELKAKENELYKPVENAIPARQQVDPAVTRSLLDDMADELGGYQYLSPVEKRVYDAVSPTTDKAGEMTYARLNQQRAVVGAELRKSGTPFGSAEERNLSKLYSALTDDRDAVAKAAGYGEQIKLANAVTAQRKQMEERMYQLLGKDLSGDVTVKAKNALTGLSEGNTKAFTQLMRAVPDKAERSQLIATGLRDMLRKGSRSDFADNISGFVDYYGALKRSGSIRLLQRELPAQTAKELEDFYTVARNVKSANQYHLTTGKLQSFLAKFESPGGFLDKLATHGKMAAVATVLGHIPVAGPVLNTAVAAQMGASMASKKTGAAAVGELMASPVWKNLAAAARGKPSAKAQDEVVNRAEKHIAGSQAWKEFYKSLPRSEKEKIARIGIIAWLSGEEEI